MRRRKAAFDTIGAVFERYGFDPLETPAVERLEVFAGKLGEGASSALRPGSTPPPKPCRPSALPHGAAGRQVPPTTDERSQ